MNPVAFVDLSKQKVAVEPVPESIRRLYLGDGGSYVPPLQLC